MILSNSDALTGCDLLRGLVFWEKPNSALMACLTALSETSVDFQALAQAGQNCYDISDLILQATLRYIAVEESALRTLLGKGKQ